MILTKTNKIQGQIQVPGDKSLSHRAFLFASLAKGKSVISKALLGEDVLSTIACLKQLGVKITEGAESFEVDSPGLEGFTQPSSELDCGNSGTTIRLLMGVLAGRNFKSILIGDESLSKRPMARIADPLKKMGASIELNQGEYPPVIVNKAELKGTSFELPIASAQLKSAMILAGIQAGGETKLTGKLASRDHTELLLPHFNGQLDVSPNEIRIHSNQDLKAQNFTVPADPSSAAFWAAATLMLPGSSISMTEVLLNSSRLGFFKVIERMGAKIDYEVTSTSPEIKGTVTVHSSKLHGVEIKPVEVPSLIDEIPILAVLATQVEGETKITGAKELRVKESDRLDAIEINLRAMGVELDVYEDGLLIKGKQKLQGAKIQTFHDHRIAMSFSIAALVAEGKTEIENSQIVDVSYPGFYQVLERIRRD